MRVVAALSMLLIVGCQRPAAKRPAPHTESTAMRIKREKVVDSWLREAKRVATDPEAKAIVAEITAHRAPAYPQTKGRFRFTGLGKDDSRIAIVPLFPQDAQIDECWRFYLNEPGVGLRYFPGTGRRLLLINTTSEYSDDMRGFETVHECVHAHDDLQNPRPVDVISRRTKADKAREEVHAYTIQNRNTGAYYGTKYALALKRAVAQMKADYAEKCQPIFGPVYPNVEPRPELDAIFGNPHSFVEKALRDTHFWVDVYFHLADQTLPANEASIQKTYVILNEYDKAGLMKMPN